MTCAFFDSIGRSWRLSDFFRCKTVTFPSCFTVLQRKKCTDYSLREEEELKSLSLFSPPTSHPESSLAYSTPTMAAKRLNLPPVPSTVASFTLSDALLPTPARWWRRPSSSRLLLARDDDDGRDVHRCSCRHVVVVLVVIVMLVVVLLLSVVPSPRCCHRRHCHRRTNNAQRPSPSPRPPPSPLPSHSHSLQLSPPPSPRCRFHRPR